MKRRDHLRGDPAMVILDGGPRCEFDVQGRKMTIWRGRDWKTARGWKRYLERRRAGKVA